MRRVLVGLLALAATLPRSLQAAEVTFAWTGTGVATSENGPLPFSLPFSFSTGDTVHGTITFDDGDPGMPFPSSSTHWIYDARTVVTIDGFDFLPTVEVNQLWLFNDDLSLGDVDQFQTFFYQAAFEPGYEVDGGIILRDHQASVFSSPTLPTDLNIADFEGTIWSLWLHAEGAAQLTAPSMSWFGGITEIHRIPEPAGATLAAVAGLFIARSRRRS
jgi:hypothetical protein